jgi:predicted cobalt transporter CbtA
MQMSQVTSIAVIPAPASRRPVAVRWGAAGFAVVLGAALLGLAVEPPPIAADAPALQDWRGNSARIVPLP